MDPGLVHDGLHDRAAGFLLQEDQHHLFFVDKGKTQELAGFLRGRSLGVDDGAAAGARAAGRFHHLVHMALFRDGHHQGIRIHGEIHLTHLAGIKILPAQERVQGSLSAHRFQRADHGDAGSGHVQAHVADAVPEQGFHLFVRHRGEKQGLLIGLQAELFQPAAPRGAQAGEGEQGGQPVRVQEGLPPLPVLPGHDEGKEGELVHAHLRSRLQLDDLFRGGLGLFGALLAQTEENAQHLDGN